MGCWAEAVERLTVASPDAGETTKAYWGSRVPVLFHEVPPELIGETERELMGRVGKAKGPFTALPGPTCQPACLLATSELTVLFWEVRVLYPQTQHCLPQNLTARLDWTVLELLVS